MQSANNIKRRLKALFEIIEREATRNPDFAAQLTTVLGEASQKARSSRRPQLARKQSIQIPDVFSAIQEKGEEEFRFWLRTLDGPTLKAIVKQNGFDPAKLSQRWKDFDKFVGLIFEQTQARLTRGSAFLPQKQNPNAD